MNTYYCPLYTTVADTQLGKLYSMMAESFWDDVGDERQPHLWGWSEWEGFILEFQR